MDHTSITSNSQDNIHVQSKIDDFFDRFKIGTLLHRCGVHKRHGHGVRSLTQAIFTLPFVGKNFFRGIVINKDVPFGKDAAYELLRGTTYNWRRVLLCLGKRLHTFFNRLTDEDRETVLIIDDSSYDRSRSKLVELLSRVYDHSTGRFLKGFRMLTICWSDGISCLPLDFSLLSSADAKKRLCGSQKAMDKRCCAHQRRKEATDKATEHLETMVKRILSTGIRAQYLLMDSWFTMPAIVTVLAKHIDVIGMVKKSSKIYYRYNGHAMDLMAIYRKLKKRRGRAKILASTLVQLKDGRKAKLVFVRDRRKKDWLALLSTDTTLPDPDIIRIYGKRWDIEVFFKMAKQHLKLAKEIQCRDYDALIAHTSIGIWGRPSYFYIYNEAFFCYKQSMPRKSRIDAPGALHHVIARGIERRDIFKDNRDRNDFLKRLSKIIIESKTVCYAWSLMPNHFHLLLKTGKVPIATVMRRLLTGYAVQFNRRHKRSGHLFQNRYKSILCEEDAYLKELVRYIHLNLLRAKLVEDLKELETHPYSGHSTIMGKCNCEWQSVDSVLGLFNERIPKARRLYRKYVESGVTQGSRPDLIGGGLIRSAGGWSAIKSLRKAGICFKSDERILGDSDFVENVLAEAQEAMEIKYALSAEGVDMERLLQVVGKLLSVDPSKIPGPSKLRDIVKARSLVCYWGSSELGMTMTHLAKTLGISISTVSMATQRGERMVLENKFSLIALLNMEI